MAIQIKVDAEAIDKLYKYCMKSPAELPKVVTRLIREWCKNTAKKWYRNYELIPMMPLIPESRMTTVGVPSVWGRCYKDLIKRINERWVKEEKPAYKIHVDELTSMLLVAYIRIYKVKQKGKWYRAKNWGNPG